MQDNTNPFADQNQGSTAQNPFTGGVNPGSPTPDPSTPAPEDNTPANFQLGKGLPAVLGIKIPANQLSFDHDYFLRLLAGSISLSKEEKRRIIETIPKLRQEQVDELIRIFEEEKQKFAQLNAKHAVQLEKLAKQHLQDWLDLETENKAQTKKQEDTAAADEIRKSLGL